MQQNALVGVNPAKAAMDLTQAQTAYQSELAPGPAGFCPRYWTIEVLAGISIPAVTTAQNPRPRRKTNGRVAAVGSESSGQLGFALSFALSWQTDCKGDGMNVEFLRR
jgi:hypothetical protein